MKKLYPALITLLLPLIMILIAGCYNFNNPVDPAAPGYQAPGSGSAWLDGWASRKGFDISRSSSGTVSGYAMRIMIHCSTGNDSGEDVYLSGGCRSDFGDIRFTEQDGKSLLSYWIQETADSDRAAIWVKVPAISPLGRATHYLYYGNPGSSSIDSGEDTFLLFDDFTEASIDADKWKGDISATEPLGWYTAEGYVHCDLSDKILYGTVDYENVDFLARVKLGWSAGGFLVTRGSSLEGEPYQISGYDLFMERASSYAYLRFLRKDFSPFTLDEEFHSYSEEFFLAGIGVVSDEDSSDTLTARIEILCLSGSQSEATADRGA